MGRERGVEAATRQRTLANGGDSSMTAIGADQQCLNSASSGCQRVSAFLITRLRVRASNGCLFD
jgi:hypothetical protein